MKRRVGILGSTGSIGVQALNVIDNLKNEFDIVFLTANANSDLLKSQIQKFKPQRAALKNGSGKCNETILYPLSTLNDTSFYNNTDIVINGISGIAGLLPTITVLKTGTTLATANKESLVAAGKYIMDMSQLYGSKIIPVDSEHSALMQCIGNDTPKKLILTASGGAFRDFSLEMLKSVNYLDALKHPTWSMGPKVTLDSATLMNKVFEILEAKWLFETDNIGIIMHRESIVHAMVEYNDGTLKMCLSIPDMKLPIQYALTYPNRYECLEHLRIDALNKLSFCAPDENKYPCLKMAKYLLKEPWLGATLTVADEIAIELFRLGRINFLEIHSVIDQVLDYASEAKHDSIDDVLNVIKDTKRYMNLKFKLM
ncbi:MAG: 1-deoxy-D-xylulose-5-phosphate reductoisomerase [Christensenellaceae bacterium]|jgi:1-deoxy-D-xylulose-5-phosphate reductoisomerase|nr:1-deoxy-D-xylulose-5-phosphate reductoisomerase [Christensenellaceae bacterium]